ncbi:MAG: hypothetical protein L6R45_22475 [Anaerolineae bacterium]|nr:hypothetical protein [Anaerolineae bacterium]
MPQEINDSYYVAASNSRPELSPEPIDKRPLVFGIIVAVVIIILFGLLGWWLFTNPPAAAVLRDIFIIFLGLGAFLIILLLIALVVITVYLVLKINDLIQLLNREIRPVLSQLQSTVQTAQGTTVFLSEQAVKPVITTVSAVAGVQAIVRSLFRRS